MLFDFFGSMHSTRLDTFIMWKHGGVVGQYLPETFTQDAPEEGVGSLRNVGDVWWNGQWMPQRKARAAGEGCCELAEECPLHLHSVGCYPAARSPRPTPSPTLPTEQARWGRAFHGGGYGQFVARREQSVLLYGGLGRCTACHALAEAVVRAPHGWRWTTCGSSTPRSRSPAWT